MQVIQHPLLLAFKECLQTRKHIYIITEYVPGVNLFEEVRDYITLQDYDAAKIAQMIIVGISYLHSLEIVHRDLKPENIMVDNPQMQILECSDSREIDLIKIIDFGFSDYLSLLRDRHTTGIL
jgi:serine/threonine protein kinase